jgi:hypothetical protein
MKTRKRKLSNETPVSFRLPAILQKLLLEKAQSEDLTFSQIIRRAVRHELGLTK